MSNADSEISIACHSRYPTPRPSRAASVQNLGGHLAPKGDHDSKKKVISFSDIVVGICYLLLEYLYLVPQYIKLVFWFVIWAVFCLLIAARSYAKKANGGTSHGGGRELAVHRSAAPLAGASGGGWSELYEKLDIRAEKLRAAKFKDETDISEDDERRRKEAAMSKYLNLIS